MAKRICKVILPVGGLGMRFLPATKAMPKEMLPVVDRPLAGAGEIFCAAAIGEDSVVLDAVEAVVPHMDEKAAVRLAIAKPFLENGITSG